MEQQTALLIDYLALFIQKQMPHDTIVNMIKRDTDISPEIRQRLLIFINSK
jgi:hypothetical protein